MAHLGKDMDLFGWLFDETDLDNDPKNKENTAADKAEDSKGKEDSISDKAEDKTSWGEDSKQDTINDGSSKWEDTSDVLAWAWDSDKDWDSDKKWAEDSYKDWDEWKDPDKDWDNDSSKAWDTDNDIDSDKDWDNDWGLKEWETDQVLEDLVKDLESSVDDVDAWRADAKEVLDKSLKDLQAANIKIKELEEQSKNYQDKYLDKFSENSELSIMKPMMDVVKDDPKLFLLVKSFKWDDTDAKINQLVDVLKDISWVDVSDYMTKGEWRDKSMETGSDENTTKPNVTSDFTPDKNQTSNDDLVF